MNAGLHESCKSKHGFQLWTVFHNVRNPEKKRGCEKGDERRHRNREIFSSFTIDACWRCLQVPTSEANYSYGSLPAAASLKILKCKEKCLALTSSSFPTSDFTTKVGSEKHVVKNLPSFQAPCAAPSREGPPSFGGYVSTAPCPVESQKFSQTGEKLGTWSNLNTEKSRLLNYSYFVSIFFCYLIQL